MPAYQLSDPVNAAFILDPGHARHDARVGNVHRVAALRGHLNPQRAALP